MNKDFVPYEQSLKLSELGFNELCIKQYSHDGWLTFTVNDWGQPRPETGREIDLESAGLQIAAPTFAQAFRWFRETYNLVHEISWSKYKGGVSFDYDIFSLVLPTDDELGDEDDIYIERPMETYDSLAEKGFRHRESDTFEEAELACLNKLIEIVKK